MEHDPRQGDLFPDAAGEGPAQRATPERRSKQGLPAPAPVAETPPSPEQSAGPARDEPKILRFPVERWATRLWEPKVEKTVRLLRERKTERGRQNLWRTTIKTLIAQMLRRGATAQEIEQQISDFHGAVSWTLADQQSGPGAA